MFGTVAVFHDNSLSELPSAIIMSLLVAGFWSIGKAAAHVGYYADHAEGLH